MQLDLEPGNHRERKPKGWRWKVAFFCLLGASGITPASAIYFYTGNEAYEFCAPDLQGPRRTMCLGYVSGLTDQTEVLFRSFNCIPVGVQVGQLADVYAIFLRDHPEARHDLAAHLFNRAVLEAFPCT